MIRKIIINNCFFASFNCKGCHKQIKVPQCSSCHKMVSYFQIFDLPPKFDINALTVQKQAKELQKVYHPDKNIESTEQEKYKDYSAYVNEAKTVLLDDLQRAIYLMRMNGIVIQEQGKIEDTQFTTEIFELQQQIESVSQYADCLQVKQRIQKIVDQVKNIFEKNYSEKNLEKCKQFIQKFIYLKRALESINAKTEQLKTNF